MEGKRLYPIRTVAQLASVNPITLRAWERRYNLLRPVRTPAGHRLYCDDDIRRIREIQELAQQGIGLAQIAAILANREAMASTPTHASPSQPQQRLTPHQTPLNRSGRRDTWPDRLEQAVMSMDGASLSQIEREAWGWLDPFSLFESLFLNTLERLENHPDWNDSDLVLGWFSDYLLGRLRWLLDGQAATTTQALPLVAIDTATMDRPLIAQEYRMIMHLMQRTRVHLVPRAFDEAQTQRLVHHWKPVGWIRLLLDEKDGLKAPMSKGGTLIIPCRLLTAEQDQETPTGIGPLLQGTPDHCVDQIAQRLVL